MCWRDAVRTYVADVNSYLPCRAKYKVSCSVRSQIRLTRWGASICQATIAEAWRLFLAAALFALAVGEILHAGRTFVFDRQRKTTLVSTN